jgi:hypothetical protein
MVFGTLQLQRTCCCVPFVQQVMVDGHDLAAVPCILLLLASCRLTTGRQAGRPRQVSCLLLGGGAG